MTQVGEKKPNELGLYDMSGNVFEWVKDIYAEYSNGHQIDPKGPNNGNTIVFRGGGYSSDPDRCYVSYRSDNAKMARLKGIDFRAAR